MSFTTKNIPDLQGKVMIVTGAIGFKEMKGKPGKATVAPHSRDKDVAQKLWQVSEELTGFNYSF